jgi:protein SCO1
MKRRRSLSPALVLAALVVGAAPPLAGQTSMPSPAKDVGFDQRLGEPLPLDAVFRDETGKAVKLGDYFGRKPVLLSLVYYECPMLCGMATEGLIRSLKVLNMSAGQEFDVLTVSFDAREGADLAAGKKKHVMAAYGRATAHEGWHFLTGDQSSIDRLTRAVGFRYVWDEKQKQFAHATGVVAVTPQGRVSKYFFGIEYQAKDLRLGVIEATDERIGSMVDRLLLLCYHYDPSVGKYTLAAYNLVRAAAALTVILLAGFVIVMLRREMRGRRLAAAGGKTGT